MKRKIIAEQYLMNATKKMIKDYNKIAEPSDRINLYELEGCFTVMFPASKTKTFVWIPFENIDLQTAMKTFLNIAEKVEAWSAELNREKEERLKAGDKVKFVAQNEDFGLTNYNGFDDKIGDTAIIERAGITTKENLGYFVKLKNGRMIPFYDARVFEKVGEDE